MPARILSGKVIAEAIKAEVATEVARLRETSDIPPGLAAVRVGDDPASAVYVASKVRTAGELGIVSEEFHLAANVSSVFSTS